MLAGAVNYRSYGFIKKSAIYDNGVFNELNKVIRKTDVQMQDRMCSGKDLM